MEIKLKCPHCGKEIDSPELVTAIMSHFGGIGGSAGKGRPKPTSAANMAKAREAARTKVSPERRAEILAKARAAKAAKKAMEGN